MSNEAEKYEMVAKEFPHDRLLEDYSHLLRLNTTLDFLELVGNNKLVLDCGCGDGIQAEKIIKINEVIGVDLSTIRIKRAKAKGLSAIVADLYKLPFKKDIFDIVVFGEVIEHLTEPQKAIEEINRVLKPKGHLIMDTPSRSNIIDMTLHPLMQIGFIKSILKKVHIKRLREKNLYDKIVNWGLYVDLTHVRFYDAPSLKKLLNISGFNIIKVRGAPCLRFDLPSIIKPRVFRIVDNVLCKLPGIKKYGAVQVFMCQLNNKNCFLEYNKQQFYENWADMTRTEPFRSETLKWKANNLLRLYTKNKFKISRIAEIGGAEGIVLNTFIKQLYYSVDAYNFEWSQNFIDVGRKMYPQINFVKQDVADKEITDKFDVIILSDIIEHIRNDKGFLNGVSKITKYVLIKLPLEDDLHTKFLRKIGKLTDLGITNPAGHLHEYTIKSGLDLIKKHFEIISYFNEDIPHALWSSKNLTVFGKIDNKIIKRVCYNYLTKNMYSKLYDDSLFVIGQSKNY